MPFTGLTVVIPTRNRAELAINAIRSVLDESVDGVRIIVSDNSTATTEIETLRAHCREIATGRVTYLAPPEPLTMTEHWDWAMERFLELTDDSHVTYLTDRMLFRRGMLAEVLAIVRAHPGRLLSFNHDKVVDHEVPVTLLQSPWTGGLYEIPSERLLDLVANGLLHNSLPRMLNSIAPRSLIHEIRARFGSTFGSVSPDFSFCFRALAHLDGIAYHDASVLLHYALYRSNGESLARGRETRDRRDFIENLEKPKENFAAPIPEFLTIYNAICHEYCLLRDETGDPRFVEIDRRAYLAAIADEIAHIENPRVRGEMEALLVRHGRQPVRVEPRSWRSALPKLLSPRKVAGKLAWLARGPASKPVWLALARWFSIRPPADARFGFRDVGAAVGYSNDHPRRRDPGDDLRALLGTVGELHRPSRS